MSQHETPRDYVTGALCLISIIVLMMLMGTVNPNGITSIQLLGFLSVTAALLIGTIRSWTRL
jgi:hypothetical protein